MKAEYIYLWEFLVTPEHVSAFERTYSNDGEWVQLFRRAAGYVRSELHRDRMNPCRYLTIDYWESEAAYENLSFAVLDRVCRPRRQVRRVDDERE